MLDCCSCGNLSRPDPEKEHTSAPLFAVHSRPEPKIVARPAAAAAAKEVELAEVAEMEPPAAVAAVEAGAESEGPLEMKEAWRREMEREEQMICERVRADAEARVNGDYVLGKSILATRYHQIEKALIPWLKKRGFEASDTERRQKNIICKKTDYPLHAAVVENDVEIVGYLIEVGARTNVVNSSGQTPEDLANKLNKSGSHQAVILLLHPEAAISKVPSFGVEEVRVPGTRSRASSASGERPGGTGRSRRGGA